MPMQGEQQQQQQNVVFRLSTSLSLPLLRLLSLLLSLSLSVLQLLYNSLASSVFLLLLFPCLVCFVLSGSISEYATT